MSSIASSARRLIAIVYTVFEVLLLAVFLAGAVVAMVRIAGYVSSLLYVEDPEKFRTELLTVIDISIYTLILIDLARTMVVSITTRRFSIEGIMEAGMLAMVREFIALTLSEKPLQHIMIVALVFAVLFIAWAYTKTRIHTEKQH